MMTTKRQTAGNNETLKRVKAMMCQSVYKAVMDAWNERGRDAARAELSRYFNTSPSALATIADVFGDE